MHREKIQIKHLVIVLSKYLLFVLSKLKLAYNFIFKKRNKLMHYTDI